MVSMLTLPIISAYFVVFYVKHVSILVHSALLVELLILEIISSNMETLVLLVVLSLSGEIQVLIHVMLAPLAVSPALH